MNPAAPQMLPSSHTRVAGFDQASALLQQLLQGQAPGCGPGCAAPPGFQPAAQSPDSIVGPKSGAYPYGPAAIQGSSTCSAWPGGPKPVRATYIGGTFPAFVLGATTPQTFQVTTKNNWFLGFKFMAPDSLMGTGLGLFSLQINGMDYLDLVTAIPLEVFNALSDNETQGRIDLCWLQTPNGQATVSAQPVTGGTTAATGNTLVCLQGFALAP